jgi:hypothetical protein
MLRRKITRRVSPVSLTLAGVALSFVCLVYSSPALAQTTQSDPPQQTASPSPSPEPEAGVDDNPTRAVFFSVREEYRNLAGGAWNNRLILRRDKVVLKGKAGGRTGFILRTDIPITTTHLGAETNTGLGDIYAQALYVAYLSRKFALVTGTGLVLPTATDKTLGLGKWQVAPLAVPVWFLPRQRGYFYVKFQEYISVAGVGDRPDVNALFITPTLNYIPARRWAIQADAESRTNWKNQNRTDFRVGFGAGRVMTHRYFLGIKCEVPFGPTKAGDWTLKVTNIFYRG